MNNLFADFKRSFERLNGKPERTLEKTRELVLLHWGTLGLYLLGCLAVAVSFQEVGFFPLFALATAGGFWYSWQRAGKPRRRDDVLLGACIALVLLMIYGVSLGRLFTAANVATHPGQPGGRRGSGLQLFVEVVPRLPLRPVHIRHYNTVVRLEPQGHMPSLHRSLPAVVAAGDAPDQPGTPAATGEGWRSDPGRAGQGDRRTGHLHPARAGAAGGGRGSLPVHPQALEKTARQAFQFPGFRWQSEAAGRERK